MAEEFNQSTFKGKIVDGNGNPLPNVEVKIKTEIDLVNRENIRYTAEFIDESVTTNSNGEWQVIISTTDFDPTTLSITFNKEGFDFKKIINPIQTSFDTSGVIDIPLSDPIPVGYLTNSTQEAFEKYKQDNVLLLIRDGRIEAGHPFVSKRKGASGGRTLGSLYYKGKFLFPIVEDIVRFDKKIDSQTAIPAGIYYITLDSTGNKNLYGNYVDLKGKSNHPANWSPNISRGVFARVGEYPDGIRIDSNPKIIFEGSRIHAGTDEDSSEGCIIVTSKRDDKGFLKSDSRAASYEVTRLIYDNNITKLVVINDWNLRTLKPEKNKK